MSQSAEDALRKLKAQIENSIEETQVIINNCISRSDYALALELNIKVQERKDIIYTINDMLDKEENHTHKWKSRINSPFHHIENYVGMRCDCGATLTQDDTEKYVNKWQEQLDHAQQMREIPKRPVPNVD